MLTFGAVEAATLFALGVAAHRLDLWMDWQVALLPGAFVGALASAVLANVGEHVTISTTRLHRYVEAMPYPYIATASMTGKMSDRIKRPALTFAPRRHDGPIDRTKRP